MIRVAHIVESWSEKKREARGIGQLVWQNYSLVEQPVDILIKKLTKLSIIDININSWSKYQIWQKYQIWPKFQKLTTMSTVDKNVKFDKNIKFDQNINLTKMSNLRCTFSKMYLPLPHLLPFDYLGDSSVLDRKEIFPSLILFCVSWNLVIGHQGQGGTDETNVFTVLVLQRIACVCVCVPHMIRVPTAFLSTNRIYALLSHFSLPKNSNFHIFVVKCQVAIRIYDLVKFSRILGLEGGVGGCGK